MVTKQERIDEALNILRQLGMPSEQLNERTAISLLALLNLPESKSWHQASSPLLRIRGILDFSRDILKHHYAENSRESVRKHSVKQLVQAGILLHNPDKPDRPVNSSHNCYQVEPNALLLFKAFGTNKWGKVLNEYLAQNQTLAAQFARHRDMHRIPLKIKPGHKITLSPGAHSNLIRSIIEEFAPRFVPGGELVYVGDTGSKWGYFNKESLNSLGVEVRDHGKMPDVIIYDRNKNWLILAEAVASSGPLDGIRHAELSELFKASKAGLVYVTAFPDRGKIMRKYLSVVAWETEVWCASDPTHLIHFNGIRFLGPYAKNCSQV